MAQVKLMKDVYTPTHNGMQILRRNRIHLTMEEWALLKSSIQLIDSTMFFHIQSRNIHPPSYEEAMSLDN